MVTGKGGGVGGAQTHAWDVNKVIVRSQPDSNKHGVRDVKTLSVCGPV